MQKKECGIFHELEIFADFNTIYKKKVYIKSDAQYTRKNQNK